MGRLNRLWRRGGLNVGASMSKSTPDLSTANGFVDAAPPTKTATSGSGKAPPPPPPDGEIELEIVLPGDVVKTVTTDPNTAMMDFLVEVTTAEGLRPGGLVLKVPSDRPPGYLSYQPSTRVGRFASQRIQVVPKAQVTYGRAKTGSPSRPSAPFEPTVRAQVELPRGQKTFVRTSPRTTLFELRQRVCADRGLPPSDFDLLPADAVARPLDSSIGDCGTTRFSLLALKAQPDFRASTSDLRHRPIENDMSGTGKRSIFRLFSKKGSVKKTEGTGVAAEAQPIARPTEDTASVASRRKKRRAPPPPPTVPQQTTTAPTQLEAAAAHVREPSSESSSGFVDERRSPLSSAPSPSEAESAASDYSSLEKRRRPPSPIADTTPPPEDTFYPTAVEESVDVGISVARDAETEGVIATCSLIARSSVAEDVCVRVVSPIPAAEPSIEAPLKALVQKTEVAAVVVEQSQDDGGALDECFAEVLAEAELQQLFPESTEEAVVTKAANAPHISEATVAASPTESPTRDDQSPSQMSFTSVQVVDLSPRQQHVRAVGHTAAMPFADVDDTPPPLRAPALVAAVGTAGGGVSARQDVAQPTSFVLNDPNGAAYPTMRVMSFEEEYSKGGRRAPRTPADTVDDNDRLLDEYRRLQILFDGWQTAVAEQSATIGRPAPTFRMRRLRDLESALEKQQHLVRQLSAPAKGGGQSDVVARIARFDDQIEAYKRQAANEATQQQPKIAAPLKKRAATAPSAAAAMTTVSGAAPKKTEPAVANGSLKAQYVRAVAPPKCGDSDVDAAVDESSVVRPSMLFGHRRGSVDAAPKLDREVRNFSLGTSTRKAPQHVRPQEVTRSATVDRAPTPTAGDGAAKADVVYRSAAAMIPANHPPTANRFVEMEVKRASTVPVSKTSTAAPASFGVPLRQSSLVEGFRAAENARQPLGKVAAEAKAEVAARPKSEVTARPAQNVAPPPPPPPPPPPMDPGALVAAMQQVRLKPAQDRRLPQKKAAVSNGGGGDSRDDLLSSIRSFGGTAGGRLKKVHSEP